MDRPAHDGAVNTGFPAPTIEQLRAQGLEGRRVADLREIEHNAHVEVLRQADLVTRPGMSRGAKKRMARQARRQGLDTAE